MRKYIVGRLRWTLFWGVLSVAAIGAAGCSSDTSRFGENSNNNPYAARAPYNQPPPAPLPPAPMQSAPMQSAPMQSAPMQPAPMQPASLQPTRTAAVERQPLPQAPPAQSPYAPQYASLQYEQPQYFAPPSQYPPSYAPPTPQYAAPPSRYGPPANVPPPYEPPTPRTPPPDFTAAAPAGGNWDRGSGATVVVAPGDTVAAIARRFGVSSQAVIQANNITNPAALAPGQRLVIPGYVVNGTGAKLAHAAARRTPAYAASGPAPAIGPYVPAASASRSAALAPAQVAASTPMSAVGASAQTLLPAPPVHTVTPGDTLGRIARKYRVGARDIAVANGIAPETPLKVGMQLTVPVKVGARSGKPQLGAPAAQTKLIATPYANTPAAAPAPGKLASSEPAANVRVASPIEPSSEDINPNAPNGTPSFRWPARGRIVNNFGAKVNGSSNDGIDLAVPEGTQVRAADDGVVAYAGNELKGYGNLVLVRHSNGFVTAYANASELLVKRNDQVHKGQVILKSGQTGNAATPQLHFEIRKNSAPVDPMQYLPADKTASAPL